jgi:hypothetical protein
MRFNAVVRSLGGGDGDNLAEEGDLVKRRSVSTNRRAFSDGDGGLVRQGGQGLDIFRPVGARLSLEQTSRPRMLCR